MTWPWTGLSLSPRFWLTPAGSTTLCQVASHPNEDSSRASERASWSQLYTSLSWSVVGPFFVSSRHTHHRTAFIPGIPSLTPAAGQGGLDPRTLCGFHLTTQDTRVSGTCLIATLTLPLATPPSFTSSFPLLTRQSFKRVHSLRRQPTRECLPAPRCRKYPQSALLIPLALSSLGFEEGRVWTSSLEEKVGKRLFYPKSKYSTRPMISTILP